MGSKRKHQGIYSLVSEKSLLDLFERDGQQLSRWSRDAKDFIGELGYLLYDTPADAHKILTKGATLFRQRDASTYILCHLIYKEIKKKKITNSHKLQKSQNAQNHRNHRKCRKHTSVETTTIV